MKIAMLGAGGFVGSNLVEFLMGQDEHHVVGVDTADDKLAGIGGPQFEFYKGDIRQDRDLIEGVVRDCDVVVDLVAYANPSIYVERPLEVVDLNFFENYRVMEL